MLVSYVIKIFYLIGEMNVMESIDIKKINKNIVHDDGTIDSFEQQLIDLSGGVFDTQYPLIVDGNTTCLSYIDEIDENIPLIMNVSTAVKIREKHDIGFAYVSRCTSLLKKSVLAFDSIKYKSSKVVVLDDFTDDGNPIVAICRLNKQIGCVYVNEINSIYDRQRFSNYMINAYNANCTFYKNEKTEHYITSHWSQLPDDMIYALSTENYKHSFTKNQVEQDLLLNVEFSDYLGYWKMIDQTESNGSIYYCFESKDDSSYPFLVVDEDLNVLCESFEELEDAVENYLSENELDMSI